MVTETSATAEPPADDDELKRAEALLKQQRIDDAANLLQALCEREPENRKALYLLAVSHRAAKRFEKAMAVLERLLEIAPEYGRAWQEIGHVQRDRNRPDEAAGAYARAVEHNPGLAASWRFLSAARARLGDADGARVAQANFEHLSELPKELQAVSSMIHEDRLYKAEMLCRHFLQNHRHHPEAMRLLADIGTRLSIFDDAEFLLESVLEMKPDFDRARMDYVNVLQKRQKFRRALEEAAILRERLPENLAVKLAYANICSAVGQNSEAMTLLDGLLHEVPHPGNIQMNRGHLLKTIGEHQKAIEAYRAAYNDRPTHGDAWWSLANMKTFRFGDDELERMKALLEDHEFEPGDEYHLCFALGKALEDRGDYAHAFQYYARGNRLKKAELRYSADRMQADFDRQKAFFTPDRVQEFAGRGSPDNGPIFIVGLPRAGSTLIEQILASHSHIDGTLELPNILAMVHRLNGRLQRGQEPPYPGVLAGMSDERFAEMGREYIEETRIHRQAAPFFTDKMPNNFRHIGLILSILPNARIIDARRAAMSCCFSGFKQLFAEGQEFSYSLSDIGRYYTGYVDLMDHWKRLYPDSILQVNYEDVVEDLETQVGRMLDFLGLPFESACVEFHRTQRSVRTASSEQVRKPIYRAGVEQWRNFEPWLGELEDALAGLSESEGKQS